MTRHALRFHIGPVKDFITTGRRTRDLWAGSFLLSRLAGEAMKAVLDGGGGIALPAGCERGNVTEETLAAILGSPGAVPSPGPLIGTLVNHFRAEVDPAFDPAIAAKAVRDFYARLALAVGEVFIFPAIELAQRHHSDPIDAKRAADIRDRWARQTSGDFFDILWCKGDIGPWHEEARWLDRRKSARLHLDLAGETAGGDRCPVHPQYLELGGFDRSLAKQSTPQDAFWQCVRHVVARRMYYAKGPAHDGPNWANLPSAPFDPSKGKSAWRDTLELRATERLSGPALVKRLFPLLSARRLGETIGWVPAPDTAPAGSDIEDVRHSLRNWPSTAFVAALPWITTVQAALPGAANAYAWAQFEALGGDSINDAEQPQFHKINGIAKLAANGGKVPLFATMDGQLHFPRGLERRRLGPDKAAQDALADTLGANQKSLFAAIKTANETANAPISVNGPSPFYAFLEMDGDNMGRAFSLPDDAANGKSGKDVAAAMSAALLEFAKQARAIVADHDGLPIYAGADDVLAMLPVNRAIDCALAISACWDRCFGGALARQKTSISGSIILADYQVPLELVRTTAHERLDKIAKDSNGRASLAIAVMKSGGIVSEWVSVFRNGGDSPPARLARFARSQIGNPAHASRLPYMLKSRFETLISGGSEDAAEGWKDIFTDSQLSALIAKELSDSGKPKGENAPSDAEWAAEITALLRNHRRGSAESDFAITLQRREIDALKVAMTLVSETLQAYENMSQPTAALPAAGDARQ